MQKDGLLYKEMKHYRRKYLIINIVCTVLYLIFSISRFPYIRTQMTGATPLDAERFASETGTVVIDEAAEGDEDFAWTNDPIRLLIRFLTGLISLIARLFNK